MHGLLETGSKDRTLAAWTELERTLGVPCKFSRRQAGPPAGDDTRFVLAGCGSFVQQGRATQSANASVGFDNRCIVLTSVQVSQIERCMELVLSGSGIQSLEASGSNVEATEALSLRECFRQRNGAVSCSVRLTRFQAPRQPSDTCTNGTLYHTIHAPVSSPFSD